MNVVVIITITHNIFLTTYTIFSLFLSFKHHSFTLLHLHISPFFSSPLQNLYGVGYKITLEKSPTCDSKSLQAYIKDHVPSAAALTNVGTELSLSLPLASSSRFPELFRHLEEQGGALGVRSFGLSVTTLEEVFIRIGKRGKMRRS